MQKQAAMAVAMLLPMCVNGALNQEKRMPRDGKKRVVKIRSSIIACMVISSSIQALMGKLYMLITTKKADLILYYVKCALTVQAQHFYDPPYLFMIYLVRDIKRDGMVQELSMLPNNFVI